MQSPWTQRVVLERVGQDHRPGAAVSLRMAAQVGDEVAEGPQHLLARPVRYPQQAADRVEAGVASHALTRGHLDVVRVVGFAPLEPPALVDVPVWTDEEVVQDVAVVLVEVPLENLGDVPHAVVLGIGLERGDRPSIVDEDAAFPWFPGGSGNRRAGRLGPVGGAHERGPGSARVDRDGHAELPRFACHMTKNRAEVLSTRGSSGRSCDRSRCS
jgi:hypothetical protein